MSYRLQTCHAGTQNTKWTCRSRRGKETRLKNDGLVLRFVRAYAPVDFTTCEIFARPRGTRTNRNGGEIERERKETARDGRTDDVVFYSPPAQWWHRTSRNIAATACRDRTTGLKPRRRRPRLYVGPQRFKTLRNGFANLGRSAGGKNANVSPERWWRADRVCNAACVQCYCAI